MFAMYRSGVRSSSAPLYKALRSNELRKASLSPFSFFSVLSPIFVPFRDCLGILVYDKSKVYPCELVLDQSDLS